MTGGLTLKLYTGKKKPTWISRQDQKLGWNGSGVGKMMRYSQSEKMERKYFCIARIFN